jgi:hypothetical protein
MLKRELSFACKRFHQVSTARLSSVPAVHQTIAGRKRFYKHVNVIPTVDAPEGEVRTTISAVCDVLYIKYGYI